MSKLAAVLLRLIPGLSFFTASPNYARHLAVQVRCRQTEQPDVISEPAFDVARRMEATFQQSTKSFPSRRPFHRSCECRPLRHDLCVWRQAIHVHHPFGFCNCLFVERRESFGKGIDKRIQSMVGQ